MARRTSTRLKGDSAVRDIQNLPDDGHLYAAHVINDLWRITDGKALVVTDVGQHQMWEAQYYKHDTPRSLITSGGLGTMGFALPAAIGAKIGAARRGSLGGRRRRRLPDDDVASWRRWCRRSSTSTIAIINNGYLGMVRQWQEFFYDKRYAATPITGPGLREARRGVRHRGDDGDAAQRRRRRRSQRRAGRSARALIDFQVEQEDSVYPMVPAGADLHKMIRRPSPIVETAAD